MGGKGLEKWGIKKVLIEQLLGKEPVKDEKAQPWQHYYRSLRGYYREEVAYESYVRFVAFLVNLNVP